MVWTKNGEIFIQSLKILHVKSKNTAITPLFLLLHSSILKTE
jgi:hypothetical protein